MSSLSDLRNELREHRKSSLKPVSKMLKHEVHLELEKHRSSKPKPVEVEEEEEPEVVVKKILKKAKAPEAVVKKAVAKAVAGKKKSATR